MDEKRGEKMEASKTGILKRTTEAEIETEKSQSLRALLLFDVFLKDMNFFPLAGKSNMSCRFISLIVAGMRHDSAWNNEKV